jgi:two-component system, OmpR family, phosphate regulon sensor histidine kinase PhoR
MLNPRWLVLLLATLVTFIVCLFLSYTSVSADYLFIAGISAFASCNIFGFLIFDYFIFKEVKSINETIKKLKIKALPTKRQPSTGANPLKKIGADLAKYANDVEVEISDLKRIEAFRKEFLANVSHELKTPIFAAQGFVHTLIDGAKDDPEVRDKFLQKAAKSLDGLDILVRDLVSLSQMESGEIKMKRQAIDMLALCIETLELLEPKANQRNVALALVANKNAKYIVNADAFRINQVLTNLIDNAIKYGNEGGRVVVKLNLEKKSLRVQVVDNGPGIAQEHQDRIFERFYRIEKSRSRELGGSGLGLAIVKHILAGHGSKIKVESQFGKGTTMSFKLSVVNEMI